MTTHKRSAEEPHVCAWCNYPKATHRGGYQKQNGDIVEEWFCCRDHYQSWLTWQAAYSVIRAQTRLSKFEEVATA